MTLTWSWPDAKVALTMNIDVIKSYQMWATRGYVTALTCKNHPYHDLFPVYTPDGVGLLCPRGDYAQDLGLADYRALEAKVKMSIALWNAQNS